MNIRTGIIGFGLAGRVFHAPLIRRAEGLDLVSVSTSRADHAPDGVRVAHPQRLIDDPDIELIVVASPNESHFPLATAALLAGKHVVVDKPFCISSGEAEQLIGTAAAAGRTLTVFHNRRWDSDFLTARRLIESDALGRIALYEAHWDRFRPDIADRWRERRAPGAGVLFDLGPHLIDQALLLFGLPECVSADLAAQRDGAEVDDYFEVRLHYGSMRVRLSASSLVTRPRPRFSVHGTGGSFVKFGLDPQEDQLKAGVDPMDLTFGFEDPSIHGSMTSADGSSASVPSERGDYLSFYGGVAAAIADGAPPPVAPQDALSGLRIIELARQASAEGRRLPFTQGR